MDIVVIDDHNLIRSGLIAALAESKFKVVAEASSVGEGLAVINKFKPVIALVDVNLGASSGLDLIETAISCAGCSEFETVVFYVFFFQADDGIRDF